MRRPKPHAAAVNRRYRPNFWAANVAYPTTVDKAQIWLAMQDAMRVPHTPDAGGLR